MCRSGVLLWRTILRNGCGSCNRCCMKEIQACMDRIRGGNWKWGPVENMGVPRGTKRHDVHAEIAERDPCSTWNMSFRAEVLVEISRPYGTTRLI